MSRQSFLRPITLGDVKLQNRIVMSPMTRGFSPNGVPTQQVAAYYARRAVGGAGLVITEGVGIAHDAALGDAGLGENHIPHMHGDAAMNGWRAVVDAVHAAGGKIIPQLWHQGVMRLPGTGPVPSAKSVAPSGVWGPVGVTSIDLSRVPEGGRLGEPLTEAEIWDLVHAFAKSAAAAASVGFDGIALHGAHGYLIDNFLWEGTNCRSDRWGGDRQRRSEFAVAVVKAIRGEIGDKPIFFRFSQWKQQDFKAKLAQSPKELEEVLAPIAEAGVDVFDASTRYFDTPAFAGSTMGLAGWAKKVTGKLSMTVGGVGISKDTGVPTHAVDRTVLNNVQAHDNLDLLLKRFENEEFDLVAVGRAMIGDPEWARKIMSGETPNAYEPNALVQLV